MKYVLIVEDDEAQRVLLGRFLRDKMNLDSFVAANGHKALEILNSSKADMIGLIITDIEMPVMDGLTFLERYQAMSKSIPVIVLTAGKEIQMAVRAMQLGAADFVTKPYDKERLVVTIWNVLKMNRMGREIDRLTKTQENRFEFQDIIGHDGDLRACIRTAQKAAMIDLPVLIQGETGTGKEVFAKAIHGESALSGSPFIAVNCGAIPPDLVESTLFGHEKGAFTGATEKAVGKFREADGGTIFLDEVAELPLSAQVKLLRVLQEGEVEPVGASRPVKVKTRIISATLRDLKKDVRDGRFREDLFYRLNVLPLTIPPLKDRPHDMLALIDYFLHKIAVRAELPLKNLDRGAIAKLTHYHWPGNVRQLENAINRAFVLNETGYLKAEDFDLETARLSKLIPSETTAPSRLRTVAELEQTEMQKALNHFEGNITRASEAIGMAKSTFYRKMREYAITRS